MLACAFIRTNVLDHDGLGVVDLALQPRDAVRPRVRVVELLLVRVNGVSRNANRAGGNNVHAYLYDQTVGPNPTHPPWWPAV